MRLAARYPGLVRVLVVRVGSVQMFMFQSLVRVFVAVILSDVQPDPGTHQRAGYHQAGREGLSQGSNGGDGSEERSGREIGAGSRGAELA
jgi:hypothetical protein